MTKCSTTFETLVIALTAMYLSVQTQKSPMRKSHSADVARVYFTTGVVNPLVQLQTETLIERRRTPIALEVLVVRANVAVHVFGKVVFASELHSTHAA